MVGEAMVKKVVSRFLDGEGDEYKVFLYFQFDERVCFHLTSVKESLMRILSMLLAVLL